MGALRARRRFAAITGSKFHIESYPLVASSQHVGAAAAVTILQLEFMLLEQYTINPEIRWLKFQPIRIQEDQFWNLCD